MPTCLNFSWTPRGALPLLAGALALLSTVIPVIAAVPLVVTVDLPASDSIAVPGEIDIWDLVIGTAGIHEFSFSAGNGTVVHELRDDTGALVVPDHDSVEGTFYSLGTGQYYITVQGVDAAATGAYTLLLARVAAWAGSSAVHVGLRTVNAALDAGGDIDLFWFVIDQPSVVHAYAVGDTDTKGELLDVGEVVIMADDDSGPDYNFTVWSFVDPGVYFVRVQGYDNTVTGPYELHIEQPVLQPIAPPSVTNASITLGWDADFFSFVVAVAGDYRVESLSNLDLVGALRDSSGAVLNDDDSGVGNDFLMAGTLPPGTYYLFAGAYDSLVEGPYGLFLRRMTPLQTYLEDGQGLEGSAALPTADGDGDGERNLAEFGFGSAAGSRSSRPLLIRGVLEGNPGEYHLSLTTLRRSGGTPGPNFSYAVDGLVYSPLGAHNPPDWNAPIIALANPPGLPAPPAGHEYATFALAAPLDNVASPADGLLSIQVSDAAP